MKRAVCGVVVVIIVVGLVVVATHRGQAGGPVYAVDTVVSGFHRRPTAWAGRTILVRGAIIWYNAEYRTAQQQGASQDGCGFGFPTVSACQRSITWDLAHLHPGSTIRLVIAPQARLFTYQGSPLLIVPQHPPGTLVVRFHVPSGGMTADGPLPRLLRQIPVVASLLPAWPGSAIPPQGIYHLRLSAHPAHDWQHDHNDGTLRLP